MNDKSLPIIKRNNVQINGNFSHISNINISPSNITIDKILYILRKEKEKRTSEEIALIKSYILKKSQLPDKFIQEHINESSYEKIIILSSPFVEYSYINKQKTIIYSGNEEANFLYIVLRGSIMIQNIIKVERMMSGYDYYQLLIKLRNEKEYFLLDKTIEENYTIYPLDKNDVFNIEKIILKLLLLKIEDENNPDFMDELLLKAKLKYSDFGIESYREQLERLRNDFLKKENLDNNENLKKEFHYNSFEAIEETKKNVKIIKKNLENFSKKKCKSYNYFLIDVYKMKVYSFEYKDSKEIKPNEYFGDFENGKYIQRAYSFSNEVDLLLIKTEIYRNFIKEDMKKIIEDEVGFLWKNYFFGNIIRNNFEKFYFRLFETVIYNRNYNIFLENNKVDYIYFIKEGEIKLTSNRSILENHMLIKFIEKKINVSSPNELNSFINNNLYQLKDYLKVKKEFKIFMVFNNDCLGIESVQFGFNYLYNAVVQSEKVKLYRIKIEKLMKIFKDKNEESSIDFREKSLEKLKMLYHRLININNMLITLTERQLDLNNKKKEYLNKQKIKAVNSLNKKKTVNCKEKYNLLFLPKLLKNSERQIKKNENTLLTKRKIHFYNFNKNYSINNKYLKKSMSEIIKIPSYEERFLNKIKKQVKEEFYDRNTISFSFKKNIENNKENKKKFSLSSSKRKSLLISYISNKAYYDNPIYETILNGNYNNFSYDFSKTIKTNEKRKLYSIFEEKKRYKKKNENLSTNALYIENKKFQEN